MRAWGQAVPAGRECKATNPDRVACSADTAAEEGSAEPSAAVVLAAEAAGSAEVVAEASADAVAAEVVAAEEISAASIPRNLTAPSRGLATLRTSMRSRLL